ncbi:hypothetical protein BDZ85DRAFT_256577 [Elsinoe ampelina]|uniref:Uncharacterized protein n=1 Tax=Elsinoe ampelina TaxID=302913 RepID=A0A6A6GLX3_9PEZI|nr:hypothetical protein BDZ85DRAFT_256577 [Elsinoe ampelina]
MFPCFCHCMSAYSASSQNRGLVRILLNLLDLIPKVHSSSVHTWHSLASRTLAASPEKPNQHRQCHLSSSSARVAPIHGPAAGCCIQHSNLQAGANTTQLILPLPDQHHQDEPPDPRRPRRRGREAPPRPTVDHSRGPSNMTRKPNPFEHQSPIASTSIQKPACTTHTGKTAVCSTTHPAVQHSHTSATSAFLLV